MTSATLSGQTSEEHLDFADMRRRIRAIFIGSIGNLVEWYDFYAYAAFALYFAGAFFPNSDPVVQQLNAALLFAAGFLVRPLGGWLFGYLADHHGRRGALMLSVSLMCFGSLMIAAAPTYCFNWYLRTYLTRDRSHHSGPEPWWRVRNQCNLPYRNGRSAESGLLLQLPIRDTDWRTDMRVACSPGIAEGFFD